MAYVFIALLSCTFVKAAYNFKDHLPEGEPKLFWVPSSLNNKAIVNLLDTFTDLPKYFGQPHSKLPDDFAFPRSFEYNAIVGSVSRRNQGFKVYNGAQEIIFDAENNRVKIQRLNKIFREMDNEI